MTRRQWMWLWIWLLLFFIIFCVWNKLQNMNMQTNTNTPVVVTPQPVSSQQTSDSSDIVATKDINLKIIKDGDIMKISGVFPSQEAVDKAIASLKTVTGNVKKGTIIIDKDANNPKLLNSISKIADDLFKFKEGYVEYNDHTLTIDGISENLQLKENITHTASQISDTISIENNTEVEEEIPEQTVPDTKATENANVAQKAKEPLPKQEEQAKKAKATTPVKHKASDKSTKEAQKELNALLKHKRVEFIYAKDELTSKSKKIINKVKDILKKYPDIHVEIGGHTDSDGTLENNHNLSQRRADAIKKYLIAHGISSKRLTAVGYGETKPLVKNDTAAHKQINRRVEFKVIK